MNTAVLGAGAWGTTLSLLLARRGHGVALWARDPELAGELARTRENALYLPGHLLPAAVRVLVSPAEAVSEAALVVVAVPAQHVRGALLHLGGALAPGTLCLTAAKGIERSTLLRVSEVLTEIWGDQPMAALSGPSFATEVALGRPTAVTVASADGALAASVQRDLSSDCFRIYTSEDLIGVELGGALKNVIAIAAGMARGLDLGANALAAVLTRGLAEMTRLGIALGARGETFHGLAGIGDLMLTGTGTLSRNVRVGEALARGHSLAQAMGAGPGVAEGVESAFSVAALAARAGVDMPITDQVIRVLKEGSSPREIVAELMRRRLRAE